jgi:Tfp pilus assembly protein PilV
MVEVLMAILLTAIAVIGIVGLFVSQTRASGRSRHQNEAAALAADKMEKLRTVSAPVSGTETGLNVQGQTGGIYERAWTVTTASGVTSLTVRVGWDEDGIAATTCAIHTDCTSDFCIAGTCASGAVVVHGKRL